jgi:formiminoglutamate deiminase
MIWAEQAYVDGGFADDVLLEISDGRFTAVMPGSPPGSAVRLKGLTFPGFANSHSHAFHRALRGRAQGPGSFWSWREEMYGVAALLDPDTYLRLARATYAEMVLAGYTCVGEFHYLHHDTNGVPYDDPNTMSAALAQAAVEAGIRLTLLDTCYLAGGIDEPLSPVQRRFSDGTAAKWAERVAGFRAPGVQVGAAIHSVRAVPAAELPVIVAVAGDRPLHVHLSEQRAENAACEKAYGTSPTRLLADSGALTPNTTAVHATHVDPADFSLLGNGYVSVCPTTERDLGDGIGPARELAAAGATLTLGSDGQSVIDPFEEMRALEMNERLRTESRGIFRPNELLSAATAHAGLGWPDAGRIAPGCHADLVTITLDSPRTAGSGFLAATAADVTDVVVGGRAVVRDGRHLLVDVPAELREVLK